MALGRPKRRDLLSREPTPGVGSSGGAVVQGVRAGGVNGKNVNANIAMASEGVGRGACKPPPTANNGAKVKVAQRGLERKTLEEPRAVRNTRTFIRSRAVFEHDSVGIDGNTCQVLGVRRGVEDKGPSQGSTPKQPRLASENGGAEAGGLNPPPAPPSEPRFLRQRKVDCNNVFVGKVSNQVDSAGTEQRSDGERKRSFHISAVLKRKSAQTFVVTTSRITRSPLEVLVARTLLKEVGLPRTLPVQRKPTAPMRTALI